MNHWRIDDLDPFEQFQVVEVSGDSGRHAARQYAGHVGFPVRRLRQRDFCRPQSKKDFNNNDFSSSRAPQECSQLPISVTAR
ncbi:MAG: hypothetical protein HT579_16345 [Candidatus Accumulibacter similis]|jgi:hypothetical protein|nr:MAG: hypothetical protein HT579_16345 [Candidatus Accumulibacter similis]